MYYVEHNDKGEILGFYSDGIHNAIPINSIPITLEEWQDCLKNQGLRSVDIKAKTLIKSKLKDFIPDSNIFPLLSNPKKNGLEKLDKATTVAQLKTVLTEYFTT